MHPRRFAQSHPQRPAMIAAETGEVLTYSGLEARANQAAQLMRALGLKTGDHLVYALENGFEPLVLAWGAQRAGIYFTPVPPRLTGREMAYIARDSGARLAVLSASLAGAAPELAEVVGADRTFSAGGRIEGLAGWEDAIAGMPPDLIADPAAGLPMLYSSGTTGFPKGIKRPLPDVPFDALNRRLTFAPLIDEGGVYFHPAPLYHTAPLMAYMAAHSKGATAIIAHRFDAEAALAAIQTYRVTHSQWVPTMFVRMLKLPDAVRSRYDLSSLKIALHAAAPCPIPVKEQMIAWWGPILYEYYGGTEGNGITVIESEDWLAHKGSVGRPQNCTVHILDEDGRELPPGQIGGVYFGGGPTFEYHNDPEKTARSRSPQGYSTLGDVGYIDGDGYLYLTDRKYFMIISGGVNIYPQEAEAVLVTHPDILDVAVIGVPDEELGEVPKAVVELVDPDRASDALRAEILGWCRRNLAITKCPRSVDFVEKLPREATGKIFKAQLRERYLAAAGQRDQKQA